MTKRTRKRPLLKRLRRQAVEVDFDGGTLTSDGGLVLLREVDRKLNLIKRIDQAIADPRDPNHIAHSQAEILTSRIFAIAAGYEDANDQQHLRKDPAFQVAAGRTPPINGEFFDEDDPTLASSATHSRMENRIDSKEILQCNEILVDTFLDSFDTPPEEITLDYDATDDKVHGNQDKKRFNAYYDSYCFEPLYVFCDDQPLVAYLRPANLGDAYHARPITKLLVARIRQRWPDVKITLRGDGGFANERLMRWCDKNDVFYIFGLPKNKVLVREIACEMTRARILHFALGSKQACFKWFRYRTERTWDRHRWVVGKAEYTGKGPNPRFVVTNLFRADGVVDTAYHRPMVDGKRQPKEVKRRGTVCSVAFDPKRFYREGYCMRGEMENRIKEQQLCMFADRTSCSRFPANQYRLMLSTFAYVLVDGLRRLGLSATKDSRLRVDTIRLRLFKIAARVRVTHRRVVFHLCSHCPWASLFTSVLDRLARCD